MRVNNLKLVETIDEITHKIEIIFIIPQLHNNVLNAWYSK